MLVSVVIVGLLAAGLTLWRLVDARRLRNLREEEQERLRGSSSEDLARAVQAIVKMEGWERHPAGAAIVARDAGWTDDALGELLEDLWGDCMKEDVELGRVHRRTSNEFELYDTGIVAIRGELDRRLGATSQRSTYRD
jgi:hypothetical protein